MARSIVVQILGDASSLEREFKRAGDSSDSLTKKLGINKKAMLKGGAIAAGGAAVAVGTKFLIGSVKAAQEAEKAEMRLEQAFKSAGVSARQRAKAQAAVNRVSRRAALDDEDLSDVLANLTRSTGSVTKAQKGMALAAEISRARNIPLAAAAKMVERAHLGMDTAFKRVGVTVDKVSTEQDKLKKRIKALTTEAKTATKARKAEIAVEVEGLKANMKAAKEIDKRAGAMKALEKATRQFSGSSERYGKTAAGAQERLSVAFENLQERVGAKLLPVLTKLALWGVRFMDWSEKNWPKYQKMIRNVFEKIQPYVEAFGKILRGQLKVIKYTVETVASLLRGDWSKAWESAKKVVTEAGAEIVKAALAVPRKVVTALTSAAWNGLKIIGTKIKEAAIAGLQGLADQIVKVVTGAINRLIGILNNVIKKFNKIPAIPNIPTVPKIQTGGGGAGGSTARTSPGQVQPGTRPSGPRDAELARPQRTTQSVVINVNGAKNPEETGRAVLRHIQRTNQHTATTRRGPTGGTALATG